MKRNRNLRIIGVYLLGMVSGIALTFRILDVQEFREKIDQSAEVIFIGLKKVWLGGNTSLPDETPNEDDMNDFVPEDKTKERDVTTEDKAKRCGDHNRSCYSIPTPVLVYDVTTHIRR